MKINNVGSQPAQTPVTHSPHQNKANEIQDLKKTIKGKEKNSITYKDNQPEDSSTGAVRNLMEGHYRGVADVRLRINFYDQINQVATQKTIETVQTWSQEFVTFARGEQQVSDKLVEIPEQIENFISHFKEALTEIINHVQDGKIEPSAIVSAIRDAFEGPLKISSLEVAEEAPSVDAPAAELLETSPTANQQEESSTIKSETQTIAVSLEHLINIFQEKLDDLEASLAQLSLLPPLSEPNGKGVAYERFLKMYNEMIGVDENADDEASSLPGDGIEIKT